MRYNDPDGRDPDDPEDDSGDDSGDGDLPDADDCADNPKLCATIKDKTDATDDSPIPAYCSIAQNRNTLFCRYLSQNFQTTPPHGPAAYKPTFANGLRTAFDSLTGPDTVSYLRCGLTKATSTGLEFGGHLVRNSFGDLARRMTGNQGSRHVSIGPAPPGAVFGWHTQPDGTHLGPGDTAALSSGDQRGIPHIILDSRRGSGGQFTVYVPIEGSKPRAVFSSRLNKLPGWTGSNGNCDYEGAANY